MKINDLVKIKTDKTHTVFKIKEINNQEVLIQGDIIRLSKKVKLNELELVLANTPFEIPRINELLVRQNTVPGLILHIDGDEHYLKKAMEAYKEYKVPAIGVYIKEENIVFKIKDLLIKHRPDIVVITGHDSLDGQDKNDLRSYLHSLDFVKAINEARLYQSNKDSLIIIAGACQSHYEALLQAGANIASSPSRENIHLLDPVIIASLISKTNVSEYALIREIINKTISKRLGGIETKGVARKIYLGGS